MRANLQNGTNTEATMNILFTGITVAEQTQKAEQILQSQVMPREQAYQARKVSGSFQVIDNKDHQHMTQLKVNEPTQKIA